MFTANPIELLSVRESLRENPANVGVGVLHAPSERIALRPFDELIQGGGHIELAGEHGWPSDECFGFIVARPHGECVIINRSQLNARLGSLSMPQTTFRNILLSLRQCWASVAVLEPSE